MKPLRMEKTLGKIKDLPTLPIVANNVIQITQNPRSSALEVGRAISRDQALSSKVLRMANSAYYGFPRKITTITHAIVLLGYANIRNLVLSVSVFEIFSSEKGSKYFDREGLWKHSLACGVTSKLIAKRLGIKNIEEVFIWGLLHDLGKLILDAHFNRDFTNVVNLVQEKGLLIRDAEQQILGFDHAELGGIVATKWNLPPALIKAIRFHHSPPLAMESVRIAAIVHLADILCRAIGMGNGGDSKVPFVNEESWKLLNLKNEMIKNLFLEIEKEFSGANALFGIGKT